MVFACLRRGDLVVARTRLLNRSVMAAVLALVLIPSATFAQSGIAGVVKDSTGAVLPGVTVEAASPALIEKVRTVVTDAQGEYKVINLRPGVYAVTFTLGGFSTVKREGIELTTDFTATVNAELRVGEVSETLTVTGQAPTVDIHADVQAREVTREVMETLPTARSNQNFAVLVPGMVQVGVVKKVNQDVGGMGGEGQNLAIHGGRDTDSTLLVDGLIYNSLTSGSGVRINAGQIQEVAYDIGGISAETSSGGVRMNIIPKDGGNLFTGSLFANYTQHGLQSRNLTGALRDRGLSAANRLNRIFDVNFSVGGPIKRDRLWVFGSMRSWGTSETVADTFDTKDPSAFLYTPDFSRQTIDRYRLASYDSRVTWQATPRNKIAVQVAFEPRISNHGVGGSSATLAPEATPRQEVPRNEFKLITWSSPISSRFLLEAGLLVYRQDNYLLRQPGVTTDTVSVLEQATGIQYRAAPSGYTSTLFRQENSKASLSYVTGSHAFKVGYSLLRGKTRLTTPINGDMNLVLLNGVPSQVVVWTTPYTTQFQRNAMLGIFAQDQWTLKRLTVNAGVRFDYLNDSIPAQHEPAGRFVPARDFAAVPNVPNWTDLSPRLGVVYDLFGDSKTALKATLNRYLINEWQLFAGANNPVATSINSATRVNLTGSFTPQESDLGPLSNANFGHANITTHYDDAIRQGFGVRPENWEASASLQHELRPGVSASLGYVRRAYGNFTVSHNLAVTPSDFDPYCFTAPVDARLPVSGQLICGLYDINPAKFGQVNTLVTAASKFGKQTEVWNGVDVNLSARLPHAAFVQGGFSTGRTATNKCFVVDDPTVLRFCHVTTPFLTQVKVLGWVGLPWDLQASATVQSLPGPPIAANYTATNAQITPSLGRTLAAGGGTVTMPLIAPNTIFGQRLNQVDVRLTKNFQVGRRRVKGMVDLYNALNASPVLIQNDTVGPAWQQPQYILPGRMLKFGGQIDF
jgi:hypothetical protein